jgi:hypothetical protein
LPRIIARRDDKDTCDTREKMIAEENSVKVWRSLWSLWSLKIFMIFEDLYNLLHLNTLQVLEFCL